MSHIRNMCARQTYDLSERVPRTLNYWKQSWGGMHVARERAQSRTINFKLRMSIRWSSGQCMQLECSDNLCDTKVKQWSSVKLCTVISPTLHKLEGGCDGRARRINWAAISIQLHRHKPWRWIMVRFKIINSRVQSTSGDGCYDMEPKLLCQYMCYRWPSKNILLTAKSTKKP